MENGQGIIGNGIPSGLVSQPDKGERQLAHQTLLHADFPGHTRVCGGYAGARHLITPPELC